MRLGIDPAALPYPVAAVAGSNGKGSVTAFAASILQAAQGRAARFTSPHLRRVNERFHVDGRDVEDGMLRRHWNRVAEAMNAWQAEHPHDRFGGFEFLFLVALSLFDELRPTAAVFECGVGGRYDPTRLLKSPVAALTSVDLEHTKLLGSTRQEIAFDKLDVAPAGARVCLGASTADLLPQIETYCALRDLAPTLATASAVDPPLMGAHQAENAAVAIALAEALHGAPLAAEAVAAGLAATRWPGRLETIAERPLTVIDVGHTPDAVRRAREGFEALADPDVLILGVSEDKPAEDIIPHLAAGFSRIICTRAYHKGRAPEDVAAAARAAAPQAEITTAPDVLAAWRVVDALRPTPRSVYVAGGLFLAIEAAEARAGRDPAALSFF
jgi:dihydrofolate synthase/folylpolyglutamate synthase